MPTFDTPEPISTTIDVVTGDVRISAADRGVTTVEVAPSDPADPEDLKVAGQTRVEYADGQLQVRTPKLHYWNPRSKGGSIDVRIELPEGSSLQGTGSMTDFRCDGSLGECQIKTGIGRVGLDGATVLSVKNGVGDISADHVTGRAEVTTGSGEVRLVRLDAEAVIKNSNGDTWIGEAGGDLRVRAANGAITVDLARAGLDAKSSNGDVRALEVVRGSVVLETPLGEIEAGIREGTAAWLDVSTTAGRVHNALDAAEAPQPSTESVQLRARTSVGDIVIRRSASGDVVPTLDGRTS